MEHLNTISLSNDTSLQVSNELSIMTVFSLY